MSSRVAGLLRRSELFARVPAPSLCHLASLAQPRRFDAGERLFGQGRPGPGVFVVESGCVRVFKVSPDRKEHVLRLIAPGEACGEMAAIGSFASPSNAEAVTHSSAVLLEGGALREALATDHALCQAVLTGVARQSRQMVELLEDVVLRDALGRVARFLLEMPVDADGALRLPTLKRHVACHLNITCETLSRTLRRLVEGGMISQSKVDGIRVLDRQRLACAARGRPLAPDGMAQSSPPTPATVAEKETEALPP